MLLFKNDTGTYIEAARVIFSGRIDELRTPVYPILCQIFTLGKYINGFYLLIALQLGVFYVSIYYFYKSLSLFTNRISIKCISTCLYAWNIPVIEYATIILTESLTISLIVILIYMLIAIIQAKASRAICIAAPILLLLLILLRPFCLCLIPVLAIAYFYAFCKKRLQHVMPSLISCIVATLLLLAYCTAYKMQYGKFALSNVTSINRALIMLKKHELKNPYPSKCKMIEMYRADSICHVFFWEYQQARDCHNEADSIYHHNLLKYATSRISAYDLSLDNYFPSCVNPICSNYIQPFQSLPLSHIYLFIGFITLIQLLMLRWKRNSLSVIATLLLAICYLSIFTTLWASADTQLNRLMLPMFPTLCMLIAITAHQVQLRRKF
ncbi:MAG: hypothetical protein ACI308_05585 [Muribaculaceae bacterium]